MSLVIHSAILVSEGRATRHGWLRIDGDRIAARGDGNGWRARALTGDEVFDAREFAGQDAVLTPGFIDLHGHGGAGAAYDDGAEAIRTARSHHRAHGTTRAVVSLVTAPIDELVERIVQVGRLSRAEDDILGSHLEGPFLNPARHGAHDPDLLIPPSSELVQRLLAAGVVGGRQTIRQVTIAPELPGAIEAIARIVQAGAVVAVGHTNADAETTRRAIDAGASLLTHTFNAMPSIHHRHPGPVPVAVADERTVLELIADGVHVEDEVMRMLMRSAPGRVALVTDAMAATGMPDGDFRIGSLNVVVVDGVARVSGTDTIAGSTLTQDAALRRIVTLGVPLSEAVAAITTTPARILDRSGELGTLQPGAMADVVLLTKDLTVARVWTSGRCGS